MPKKAKIAEKKKDEIQVNLKVPREWGEVRESVNLKWKDIIRLGLSVAKET